MKLFTDVTHIYCVVEKDSFTDSWYEFAKGGDLSPRYVDFFTIKESAVESINQLKIENPELEFDIMKTQTESFSKHWKRSTNWSHN
jgi:hypothetical protein